MVGGLTSLTGHSSGTNRGVAMLARFGMAIYWVMTTIAVFLALGTVVMIVMGTLGLMGQNGETALLESVVFIPAFLFWLIGRASRYYLVRDLGDHF
jgi:hypothetical protein